MKKEKEILKSIIKLKQVAKEQGIDIKEISLMGFWFEEFEMLPEDYKLLGIKIV